MIFIIARFLNKKKIYTIIVVYHYVTIFNTCLQFFMKVIKVITSITFMKNLQVKTNFFFIRAGPCDHKYKKEYTFMQGD